MKQLTKNQNSEVFSRKWVLVVGLCCTLIDILLTYFGDPGRGRAAAIGMTMILFAARKNWTLRGYAWFWILVTIIVALHVLLILLIPWTSKSYPGPTLLPFALVDYAIVCGCIRLCNKGMQEAL